MTYAFTFDASACTGCKACQVACKDKNNLPTGVLWRRVYEISGGTWTQQNDAWTTDVFAYNLSIACNHCLHPKCAGVCPADAYLVRADGIVLIDELKCMGCGYCAWACPYSAPRYNPELGRMTKCNFCFDNLDAGLPPACVAACPLRALECVTVEDGSWTAGEKKALWEIPGAEHPFPLPVFSRTQPHLALKPHVGMLNGLEKLISNREEIRPSGPQRKTGRWEGLEELPLVVFTLLAQMAVGAFWALPWTLNLGQPEAASLRLLAGGVIGVALGGAGLAAFAHLGTPLNAWRALSHLKKSWMSREILAAGLFTGGWALWMLAALSHKGFSWLDWGVSLLGMLFVHSMAQVYRIKGVPAWNTWRTNLGFFLTALLLGQAAMLCVAGIQGWFWVWLAFVLAAQAGLLPVESDQRQKSVGRIRLGLILAEIAGAAVMFFVAKSAGMWLSIPIFLLILLEEALGRWLFYEKPAGQIL